MEAPSSNRSAMQPRYYWWLKEIPEESQKFSLIRTDVGTPLSRSLDPATKPLHEFEIIETTEGKKRLAPVIKRDARQSDIIDRAVSYVRSIRLQEGSKESGSIIMAQKILQDSYVTTANRRAMESIINIPSKDFTSLALGLIYAGIANRSPLLVELFKCMLNSRLVQQDEVAFVKSKFPEEQFKMKKPDPYDRLYLVQEDAGAADEIFVLLDICSKNQDAISAPGKNSDWVLVNPYIMLILCVVLLAMKLL